jgi:hypothetical protein
MGHNKANKDYWIITHESNKEYLISEVRRIMSEYPFNHPHGDMEHVLLPTSEYNKLTRILNDIQESKEKVFVYSHEVEENGEES